MAARAARDRIAKIIVTTGLTIPGREITEIVGVVATEAAIGLSVFKDIANNWRDFIGGRANTAQSSLKEARAACLQQIRQEAGELGADAIIALDLDYNELSTAAGSGGILFVAATGTAVKLE